MSKDDEFEDFEVEDLAILAEPVGACSSSGVGSASCRVSSARRRARTMHTWRDDLLVSGPKVSQAWVVFRRRLYHLVRRKPQGPVLGQFQPCSYGRARGV